MEVILVEPDIPQNVGNIARTASVTGTKLTLVRPLGFSLASRHLKRAGLDYWKELNLEIIEDLDSYLLERGCPFYFFSSKAKKRYTEVNYTNETMLIFGSETKGLPSRLVEKWENNYLTIPMKEGARCLNLATSVGIAVYEGVRQLDHI